MFVISDSKADLTKGAGSAVKRSNLFAATKTGISVGAREVLVFARFCNRRSKSWRYSAVWRRASFPIPLVEVLVDDISAASTMNIIPLRFWGLMMVSKAWWRSLPCPGVSARRNFLWNCVEGSAGERYWEEAAGVERGRESSTVRGVWEVRVVAGRPLSNWGFEG